VANLHQYNSSTYRFKNKDFVYTEEVVAVQEKRSNIDNRQKATCQKPSIFLL